jgi:hypothetical protein
MPYHLPDLRHENQLCPLILDRLKSGPDGALASSLSVFEPED